MNDTSWISFDSNSRVVSWSQSSCGFNGDYLVNIIGIIVNDVGDQTG